MAEVKSVSVRISADGYEDAKLKIDKLSVAADKLKAEHPKIDVEIDSAKALLEARLLRDGIKKELSRSVMDVGVSGGGGKGGFLSSLFGGGGSSSAGGAGFSSLVSGGFTSPAGIAGITALLPELSALVTGFAAAGAGVGAFGALAIPTFDKIKNAFTSVTAAQKTYNAAAALEKEDPTKTHATDAANALVKLKLAEEQMSPATRTAVGGIQQLISTYENMAKAFAPDALKVFNSALRIANTLLPDLKPFADAAAGAINGLLGKVNTFFKSADFKKWLGSFSQFIGPSITAIGDGIGKVAVAIGKLLTGMSVKDVVHGIATAFDILAGAIDAVAWTVKALMKVYNSFSQSVEVASGRVLGFFSQVVLGAQKFADGVLGAFGDIIHGARVAADFLGIHTLDSVDNTFRGIRKSVHDNLSTAANDLQQWADDMSRAPKIFHLRGDITDLQAKLGRAEAQLKDPNLTKDRKVNVLANIQQLEYEIARAKEQIASLQGKTVYINTVFNTVGRPEGQPRAHAAGGWASGLSLVGEQGPELVSLPSGSYVHTAADSRRMMGGSTYIINQYSLMPTRENGGQIVEAIRQYEQGTGSGWRK